MGGQGLWEPKPRLPEAPENAMSWQQVDTISVSRERLLGRWNSMWEGRPTGEKMHPEMGKPPVRQHRAPHWPSRRTVLVVTETGKERTPQCA